MILSTSKVTSTPPSTKGLSPMQLYQIGNPDPSPLSKSFLSLVKSHTIPERVLL